MSTIKNVEPTKVSNAHIQFQDDPARLQQTPSDLIVHCIVHRSTLETFKLKVRRELANSANLARTECVSECLYLQRRYARYADMEDLQVHLDRTKDTQCALYLFIVRRLLRL